MQLAAQHPECSAEEVEDAVQYACKSILDEAEGITDPGKVYAWIRTAAHRALNRAAQHQVRELAVDPLRGGLDENASEDPGPEEELIAQEDKGEMATLVREVAADLPERRSQVLALYVTGFKRPEIASRLGLTERTVKRDLLEGDSPNNGVDPEDALSVLQDLPDLSQALSSAAPELRREVFDAFRLRIELDRNAGQIRLKALVSSAFSGKSLDDLMVARGTIAGAGFEPATFGL